MSWEDGDLDELIKQKLALLEPFEEREAVLQTKEKNDF
jgi:hypothetical protein